MEMEMEMFNIHIAHLPMWIKSNALYNTLWGTLPDYSTQFTIFMRKYSMIYPCPQVRISDKPSHRGHRCQTTSTIISTLKIVKKLLCLIYSLLFIRTSKFFSKPSKLSSIQIFPLGGVVTLKIEFSPFFSDARRER